MARASAAPTLEAERALMSHGYRFIVGMDEVGRGALAGPATVGAVMIDAATAGVLSDVRDSKLLSPTARTALVDRIEKWSMTAAVGHAGPGEIDRIGISRALGLAGRRALAALAGRPDAVLLDGKFDWLTDRGAQPGLLEADIEGEPDAVDVPVHTQVKADLTAVSVAAASVLAKVERDELMTRLAPEFPRYEWQANKGYGTADHRAMIARFGSCRHHRNSWRLPTVSGGDATAATFEA